MGLVMDINCLFTNVLANQ